MSGRRWAIFEPPALPFETGHCLVRVLDPPGGLRVYEGDVEVVEAKALDDLRATLANILDAGFHYAEEYRQSIQEALE